MCSSAWCETSRPPVKKKVTLAVLFRFGPDAGLALSQIFSQCILNIFLIEKNMYAFLKDASIRTKKIVQTRNDVHTLFYGISC